jgi:hypothetical protein
LEVGFKNGKIQVGTGFAGASNGFVCGVLGAEPTCTQRGKFE